MKGGSYDVCGASFSIDRRIVLSLVCRNFCNVVCRQVAVELHGEALARIHAATGTRPKMQFAAVHESLGVMSDLSRRFRADTGESDREAGVNRASSRLS
jgi:hypothetical protein